jgi:hypothetical protein
MAGRRSVSVIAVAVGVLVGVLGVIGASAAPPAEADASAVTKHVQARAWRSWRIRFGLCRRTSSV